MDTPRKKIIADQKENNSYQEISEADQEIYDFLDMNFVKDNTDSFSSGFSNNIIRKIESKQQRKFNLKIYALISILLLISIPLFMSFLNNDLFSMISTVVKQNKFIIAFLICGVILIQFSERLIYMKKDMK